MPAFSTPPPWQWHIVNDGGDISPHVDEVKRWTMVDMGAIWPLT